MEELTPAQKKVYEEIYKKVDTLKFLRTHVRWAGVVVQFVGYFMSNTTVMLVGTFIFLSTYMMTVSVMEDINLIVWKKPDEQTNEEDKETK